MTWVYSNLTRFCFSVYGTVYMLFVCKRIMIKIIIIIIIIIIIMKNPHCLPTLIRIHILYVNIYIYFIYIYIIYIIYIYI